MFLHLLKQLSDALAREMFEGLGWKELGAQISVHLDMFVERFLSWPKQELILHMVKFYIMALAIQVFQ